ncbi:MAG: hypothetical protein B7Y99_07760 [Caulobacterales bacterium 32-69-10]|nr:MAG: hypothetical protein B7Y99_07760 [Caulobacterales bacterium 32-69-10]
MAKLKYAIMRFGDEWKVVSGERRIGHFATMALAVNAGARLAREAMAAGHEVEFMVQDGSAYLQSFDVMQMAARADARQGGTSQPADEGPSPPGVRVLEL